MFGRIANALHPDKEQNEHFKKEKYQLMTSLIEARDQKDIPTIFAMCYEHVREMPEDFAKEDEDLENIVALQEYPLEKLKRDYDLAPHQNQNPKLPFFTICLMRRQKKAF